MLRRTLLSTFAALMLATPSFADDPLRIGVEGAYPPFFGGKMAAPDMRHRQQAR